MTQRKAYRKYNSLNFLQKSRTWAEIDLGALKHNFTLLSSIVKKSSPECRPVCVVKADAYSHSMSAYVPALIEVGADFFAVSSLEEALAVKDIADSQKKKVRILILGYTLPSEVSLLIDNDITQTVFSLDYALALDSAVEALGRGDGKKLDVHIKLDTGMNRLGFGTWHSDFERTAEEISTLCSLANLDARGIFTHFARADEADPTMTELQAERYMRMLEALAAKGITFSERHLCNSAGSIAHQKYHFDLVRLGILLFGLSPSSEVKVDGLVPVMRLKTIVSHIHTLQVGETVSYGGHFSSDTPRRLATLPIGYADGFVRACGGGVVTVKGQDVPIVGNICMDQCMVDITDAKGIEVGDTVTVYGDTPDNIERFAQLAGTINYELVCLVSGRVPRIITE